MTDAGKTHFRKAFDSPYLSSADIVEPTVLTVKFVRLEKDRTKKTPDFVGHRTASSITRPRPHEARCGSS